jgi:hypothetical protein
MEIENSNKNLNINNTENNQPTQLEMVDILTVKIKKYNNVDIKTKEFTNNVGKFYAITAHIKLSDIGNSVFHSATLKTVSYNKRIVNIKCVFSDNENLKHDMKINRDSVFQCFRDIAPDTIITISLEDFKDQSEQSHLRIIASTIKGASLIFVYKRLMEFVKIINEKYGNLISTPITPTNDTVHIPIPILHSHIESINKTKPVTSPVTSPVLVTVSKPDLVIESKPVPIIPKPTFEVNNTMSENIIKELDEEEKRLQKIIENIKLLKQTQLNYISSTNININISTNMPTITPTPTPILEISPVSKIISIPEQSILQNDISASPPTFASKVKQSLKF